MNFRQRLNRYLIGVVLGLVLVAIFFGNRDWLGWTPNSVVLRQLIESNVVLDQLSQCQMNCLNLTYEDIQVVLEDGNIDFRNSQVEADPKIYEVESGDHEDITFYFELHQENSKLVRVESESQACDCE